MGGISLLPQKRRKRRKMTMMHFKDLGLVARRKINKVRARSSRAMGMCLKGLVVVVMGDSVSMILVTLMDRNKLNKRSKRKTKKTLIYSEVVTNKPKKNLSKPLNLNLKHKPQLQPNQKPITTIY